MSRPAVAVADRRVVALLLAAVLAAVALSVSTAPPAQADASTLYTLLNQSRKAAGLPPVVRDSRLDAVAQSWTASMASKGTLGHNPSYSTQIPSGWSRAGENVGYYSTDANLHAAWMASAGHKANILGSYTSVGIGWVKDSSGRVWGTQLFASYPGVTAAVTPPSPTPATFLLAADTPGPVTTKFEFGHTADTALIGDWNADGVDTVGARRGNVVYLRDANAGGEANRVYALGRATDQVLVGDWDGNGTDTLGVRRGNSFYLSNGHSSTVNVAFRLGRSTDSVYVGDWNGDGKDTIAIRRGNTYFVADRLGAAATRSFQYGTVTDRIVVGDWDGDRLDTLGVRRVNVYHLTNDRAGGAADLVVGFGTATDRVLVGDFDEDGADSLGVRR